MIKIHPDAEAGIVLMFDTSRPGSNKQLCFQDSSERGVVIRRVDAVLQHVHDIRNRAPVRSEGFILHPGTLRKVTFGGLVDKVPGAKNKRRARCQLLRQKKKTGSDQEQRQRRHASVPRAHIFCLGTTDQRMPRSVRCAQSRHVSPFESFGCSVGIH